MKQIPIILTLLLMGAWVYTSWYWYTCNIKGFCDDSLVYIEESENQTNKIQTGSLRGQMEETQTGNTQESQTLMADSQKLSASDVLSAYQGNDEATSDEQDIEAGENLSGSLLADLIGEQEADETNTDNGGAVASICSVPLIGPIGIDNTNNKEEVKRLENFLNSQGESLPVDGEYSQQDLAAVNRFQLKYKAQILDPWGLNNPTGYVFRTTVQTMNAVACGEDFSPELQKQEVGSDDGDIQNQGETTSTDYTKDRNQSPDSADQGGL